VVNRKISKFDATRCQILKLKCTKIDFCWGSAPDTAGGAYRPPSCIQGAILLRGRRAKRKREGREREGEWKRRGREVRKREGRGEAAPKYFGLEAPLSVTCYLRLMGYVAVSFECPYLASFDPACS